METVRIVKAKNPTVVGDHAMRKQEGKVVAHHFLLFVDPNFLAKNADPASAAKRSLIVGILAQTGTSAH